MKDVDQTTGKDLNPTSGQSAVPKQSAPSTDEEHFLRAPDRPRFSTGNLTEEDISSINRRKRMSSPERWEIQQMIASGCINRNELPIFDEDTGLLPTEVCIIFFCKKQYLVFDYNKM